MPLIDKQQLTLKHLFEASGRELERQEIIDWCVKKLHQPRQRETAGPNRRKHSLTYYLEIAVFYGYNPNKDIAATSAKAPGAVANGKATIKKTGPGN